MYFTDYTFSPFPLASVFPTVPFEMALSPLSTCVNGVYFSPGDGRGVMGISKMVIWIGLPFREDVMSDLWSNS